MIVFVDNLEEGMVLSSDLLTRQGRLIIAQGVTLEAQHLKVLKSWGITEADIVDNSIAAATPLPEPVSAQEQQQAASFLALRFHAADVQDPFFAELYRLATKRLARQLADGYPLPQIHSLAAPACEQIEQIVPGRLVRAAGPLISLPEVYHQIVEALNSPRVTSSMIADIVSKDTSLAMKLLRLVNSAFYGLPGKVDSISRAITMIGTNELTTLALGISVMQTFARVPGDLIDMERFWKHAIRCGLFAQVLGSHKIGMSEERLFVGGLLHDIGRLIMLSTLPEAYSCAIHGAREEHEPLYVAEQRLLGCHHAELGGLLGKEWNLAPALIRMIAGHHTPGQDLYGPESCLLHIADLLAHLFCNEAPLVVELPRIQLKAWQVLGLSASILAPTVSLVERMYRDIVAVFLD